MRRALPILALLSLSFAPAPAPKFARSQASDRAALQGEWRLYQIVAPRGVCSADTLREAGMEIAIEISEEKLTYVSREPQSQDEERSTFAMKPIAKTSSPRQLLLVGQERNLRCVYKVNADALTIRLGDEDDALVDFTTLVKTREDDGVVMVFKRKRP